MLNSIAKNAQTVATNQNVLFTETRVKSRRCACNTGWLAHDNGSGLFEITNRGNLPMAVEVEFNGNVTASAIGAVALSIKQNGEPVSGTEMYQNVGAATLIAVPAGSSVTISVGNVGTVDTLVKDANIIIKKLS